MQLHEAETKTLLALRTFEAEPTCWRSYAGPGGGIIDIKPDAFVETEVGDFVDSYFIEVDLATESPRTIRAKALAYVYGVGTVGQRLLDQEPRRPWTPRPSWLRHVYPVLRQDRGNDARAG